MKTIISNSVLRLCLILITLGFILSANAYDFEVNGIYYNINGSTASVTYCSGHSYEGIVNIPATVQYNGNAYTVRSIGDYAFSNCEELTYVSIPETVTSIKFMAFTCCTKLTSISIPNSVKEIGYISFAGSGLINVDIPNSVETIEDGAFFECTNLTSVTIGNSVSKIRFATFRDCTNLKTVVIPSSIDSIGSVAFADCPNLERINCYAITPPVIESDTFDNYDAILYVSSQSMNLYQNTNFWNNFIILPFDSEAYYFSIDGITYLITDFNGKKVTVISADFDLINDQGFVNIPAIVVRDGISYYVTAIGPRAFRDCPNLTSIAIPAGISSIGGYAFENCTSLADISIPNSVTTIGNGSFNGCNGLLSIRIGNSVSTIGEDAFCNCIGLTSVNIPASVTYIGNNAFSGCTSLTEVNYNSVYCADFNSTSPFIDTFIESIHVGNEVQYIPANFVKDLTTVRTVNIENSVSTIGSNAFSGCTSLTEVSIPNSVTTVGNGAFNGCNGLLSLRIGNSLSTIGEDAFCNCISLTSVNIPPSVTYIGNNAFSGCTSLTEVNYNAISCADFNSTSPFLNTFIAYIYVGNEVQYIPSNFVKDLTTVRTVNIGNSVSKIGSNAFSGCKNLTDVLLGNSVTTINNNAFYGCTSLQSIALPTSVRIIRSKAFYNCSGLKSVYSNAISPPVMESNDCFNCYNTATLYVPYDVLDIYKNTYYWNNFYRIYGVDENGNILVTGLTLDVISKNLNVNQTFRLTATVTPDYATNKTINWTSSNPSVASVDSTGFVTALSAGTATITATTTDGSNLSASCEVTVSIIPMTSLSLNKTSLTLDVDDTYQLSATITPSNATYKTLSWTSSNPAVATVSDNGLVTPVSPGEATITATTTDGTNLSASCEVTVIKRIKSIALNESSLTLTLPQTTQMVAFITPDDATNQAITWTSSNTSVATVDINGFVISKAVGTTTIKATTKDGSNLSATCHVTVVKQYVTSITLNESSLVMHIGDTFQLIADVQPDNASNPVLSWSTGNSSVASVDNNGLVTAKAGGTTYVRASATDGSNRYANCTIEVLPDYYITLDTLSHIRGMATQIVDLPISLINKNPISGIQFDISLPSDVEFNLVDSLPDVWLDETRATRTHSITASQLSNGKYRVLVTSSASRDLRGNDGELVHMNMLLPQQHDIGNRYINITNIIASEADETRHILDNKSTAVHFYYIVGDADANAVVDIADHAATASKILGKTPSPFFYDAANVDANNSLDVVDLVGITNIALGIKPITIRQAPRRGGIENRLFCDELNLNAGGEKEITVGIDCGFDFAGFQMDVKLPNGLTLIDASLDDEAAKISLATETMPDGTIRFLVSSFSDAVVNGVCPQLLTLRVKAERNYQSGSQLEFSDILFAERDLTAHYFDGSFIEYVEPCSVYELMDDARIYVEYGNIIVDTPVAGTVQLIAVDGRMIEYQANVGHNVYPVDASGIYIIHFLNKTIKVYL